MRKGKLRFILIVMLATYVIIQGAGVGTASLEETVVSVDPLASTCNVGQSFNIDVTIANVTNLYSWQFNMTFNPSILNVTNVQHGPFLGTAGPATLKLPPVIDNINGWVFVSEMFFLPLPPEGANGSGVLATVTFDVKGVGVTLLNFVDELVKLYEFLEGNNVPIPHVTVDGIFDNLVVENDSPVALFDAEPLPAEINETITFNASASYDPNDWLFSYYWDFGDGTNATGIIQHVKWNTDLVKDHEYEQGGIYVVTLSVTDYYGATNSTTAYIAVGHDVAVTSLQIPYTAVMPGIQVPINVTVANERGFSETFNVTAYYDNTTIGIETVNLAAFAQTTATFIWNTTSLSEDDYTIIVEASNVTNEINIENNMKNHTITLAPFNRVSHSVEVGGFTFHVITTSNSIISDFSFTQADKKIQFDITGEVGTSGFCNVTIPKNLLDAPLDQWNVLINDVPVIPPQLSVTENTTHTFIYVIYTHSAHTVQIIGKTVATPPVAAFTQTPETPIVGEVVVFNSTSYDPDGTITNWEWDLNGDDTIDAYTENTTYTYNTTGIYTATLTVRDDKGLSNSTELNLKVMGYPSAVFTYFPRTPIVGDTITFNASTSYDLDGWIASYTWNFGDGNITAVGSTKTTITHSYVTAGTYDVTLNVTDNDGLTNMDTQSVNIGKMSSTIDIGLSPKPITLGENTTISGSIDPERSEVTVTIWYRLKGEETWSKITTPTDENSHYSYVWTPESEGTYEIKASWEGDENTFADETEVQELIVKEAAQPSGSSIPPYLIALIAAIVIVIVVITGYLMKTRKPR
jgi:PKD repeat protein